MAKIKTTPAQIEQPPKQQPIGDLLSTQDAMRKLGVKRTLLYKFMKHQKLPYRRLTRNKLGFVESELDAWLDERKA